MITSGLVVTLSSDPVIAAQALDALRARPELMLGDLNQRWLPVAAEVSDVGAGRDLHDWLSELPGVDFVDVMHVSFDETETATTSSPEVL